MEKKHRFYFGDPSKEPAHYELPKEKPYLGNLPEKKLLSIDYCRTLCPNKIKCRNNPAEVKEKCKDVYKGKSVFIDFIPEITPDGKFLCTNIRIIGEKED